MKNFDKYMQDILIESNEQDYQVTCWWRYKYLRELTDTECSCDDCTECQKQFFEWLNEEYKEPIKLTSDEKVILRNLPKEYNWIVRDSSNYICIHQEKPMKMTAFWDSDSKTKAITIFNDLFQFIKFEDKEPYSIEELLKEN